MSRLNIQATKERYIEEILENDVYLTESSVYKRLFQVLCKLSNDDLGCLALIMKCKNLTHTQRREDGYHPPSSVHVVSCPGCTSDPDKWGKPINKESI